MLTNNLSEVDVACTTISANATAEQHVGVPMRANANVAVDRRLPHDACVVVVDVVVHLSFAKL